MCSPAPFFCIIVHVTAGVRVEVARRHHVAAMMHRRLPMYLNGFPKPWSPFRTESMTVVVHVLTLEGSYCTSLNCKDCKRGATGKEASGALNRAARATHAFDNTLDVFNHELGVLRNAGVVELTRRSSAKEVLPYFSCGVAAADDCVCTSRAMRQGKLHERADQIWVYGSVFGCCVVVMPGSERWHQGRFHVRRDSLVKTVPLKTASHRTLALQFSSATPERLD